MDVVIPLILLFMMLSDNKRGKLPPRGTGLRTGRTGERRAGKPRSEWERYERHYGKV